ncbi:MAG TPA: GxxExxY protein [Balneolaceae bacterium]|nr:GxxExxY protein [Balneolaceae bacterium]
MTENQISYLIKGAIFEVYNELGPGLFESVYQKVLYYELVHRGLDVLSEVVVPIYYKNEKIEAGFRVDLLVNNKVLVELKSVETLQKVHHKQVLTYLKLTNLKLGILVNFNSDNIAASIHRKVNRL